MNFRKSSQISAFHFRYSFAIVGINMTHLAYKMLKDGILKSHMFNVNQYKPSIENFHHFYRYWALPFLRHFIWCLHISVIYSLNLTSSGWSANPRTSWSSTESETCSRTILDRSFRTPELVSKWTFRSTLYRKTWSWSLLYYCISVIKSIVKVKVDFHFTLDFLLYT